MPSVVSLYQEGDGLGEPLLQGFIDQGLPYSQVTRSNWQIDAWSVKVNTNIQCFRAPTSIAIIWTALKVDYLSASDLPRYLWWAYDQADIVWGSPWLWLPSRGPWCPGHRVCTWDQGHQPLELVFPVIAIRIYCLWCRLTVPLEMHVELTPVLSEMLLILSQEKKLKDSLW